MNDNQIQKKANVPTTGNVPTLRFPEFSGEWERKTLEEVGKFSKGVGISKDQRSDSGNPCILYGELYTHYKSEVISEVRSKTNLPEKSLVKSVANDIIIPASGETAKDIATARCVPFDNVFIGGDLNIIRLSQDDGRFISYQLNGVRKYDIAKVAQGVSVVHLHGDDLKGILINVPSILEQNKIAEFLSLIDERIAIQNKIIEDLKKLKVGICRKCFSKHPHNNSPLQSYFDYGKAGGTPTSTNKDYYDGDIPFLSINDITKQGKYIKSTDKTISDLGLKSSTAWVVPPYSLILSMYASVGLPAINTLPLATSQAMFSMVLSNNSNLDYLYYFLLYFKERVVYKYLETGTQSNINADIVKSIIVPDYGEDNIRIGQLLSSIDARLQDAVTQGTLYHKQKEVLLRKLFI